jgi:hypothetical protein
MTIDYISSTSFSKELKILAFFKDIKIIICSKEKNFPIKS